MATQEEINELRLAAIDLLMATIKDAGDPDDADGDTGTVGYSQDPETGEQSEMAVTFAMMIRLRSALAKFA